MRFAKNLLVPGTYTKPNIYLCETDKTRICKLETSETKASLKFNSLSELSFEVARVYNDDITGEILVNPYYDKIEALRLIYVESFGYFELQGPELISDGIKESKSCKAYSLEYVLSQKYLDNFLINKGTVDSLEVLNADNGDSIVPITLYNKNNPKLSLLHLILEKCYGCWTIGHVDEQLQTMSRQFEIDRESIYDFLMNEVCEKFNCYVVFNTINNTINVYAESPVAKFKGDGKSTIFKLSTPFSSIETVSIDGYKTTQWTYGIVNGSYAVILESAPEDGAYVEVVGVDDTWDTDVFVSFDNLAKEVNVNYNADDIKTVLTVTYGDDLDIREVNLGLPYLTDISYYYTVDWMGQDLYDEYGAYLTKVNKHRPEYSKNAQELVKLSDQILYRKNRLSLEYSIASVNESTVGVYYIKQNDANGNPYYSEVSLPADYNVGTQYYSNMTTNVNEEKVSSLYSSLKKYACGMLLSNYVKKSEAIKELKELEGFEFLSNPDMSGWISQLEKVNSKDALQSVIDTILSKLWAELGKTPLEELYLKPYQQKKDAQLESEWSSTSNENYGSYFVTVCFIDSINEAIAALDEEIQRLQNQQEEFSNKNAVISDALLMSNNFTQQQLMRLSAFLREDELHLDDFVETSLDDLSSSLALKQDAMESGRLELKKLCQPQMQFSMTMANIYALSEFEPIIDQFQLGNIIRVAIRKDYIKQARLLQVDVNFDDFSDFSCEFGELTNLRTQSDIHADLLSNAITAGKSVANYSSYWSKGSDTASSLEKLIQQGLLDSVTEIKAIDGNQGTTIDKYGIHLRKVDPMTGELDPKQGWIVNNKFLYSDDGFRSSKAVFGEYTFDGETYYGMLAEALVGKMIVGTNLKIEGDGASLDISKNAEITALNANLKVANDTIVATVGQVAQNQKDIASINISADEIKSVVEQVGSNKDSISMLQQTADSISTRVEGYDSAISNIQQTSTNIWSAVFDDQGHSKIEQTASMIEMKVGYGDIIAAINMSTEGLTIRSDLLTIDANDLSIDASKIVLEGLITANNNFQILYDGSIKATNADISGHITSESGTIGGFDINHGSLSAGSGNNYIGLRSKDLAEEESIAGSGLKQDWRIIAGENFGVDSQGNVYASKLTVTGGVVGDCIIDDSGKLNVGFGNMGSNEDWRAYISGLGFGSGEGGGLNGDDVANIIANELSNDASKVYGATETIIKYTLSTEYIVAKELEVSNKGDIIFFASSGSTQENKPPQVVIGGWLVDKNSICSGTVSEDGKVSIDVGLFSSDSSAATTIGKVATNTWRIVAGNQFGVASDGTLSATNAYISGQIDAGSGTIGGTSGWQISGGKLYSNNGGSQVGLYSSDLVEAESIAGSPEQKNWRIIAGNNFGVDSTGGVYAKLGKISGWNINQYGIFAGDADTTNRLGNVTAILSPDSDSTRKLTIGNVNASNWRFAATTITDTTGTYNGFGVTADGVLSATNAVITGTINATAGNIGGCTIDEEKGLIVDQAHIEGELTASSLKVGSLFFAGTENGSNKVAIGGWNVDNNSLYSTYGDSSSRVFMCTGTSSKYTIGGYTDNWYFGAGSNTGPGFGVATSGKLYASGAEISGAMETKSADGNKTIRLNNGCVTMSYNNNEIIKLDANDGGFGELSLTGITTGNEISSKLNPFGLTAYNQSAFFGYDNNLKDSVMKVSTVTAWDADADESGNGFSTGLEWLTLRIYWKENQDGTYTLIGRPRS